MTEEIKPRYLVAIAKQFAGGTETISISFNPNDATTLASDIALAHAEIDKRNASVKAEMEKVQAEVLAKAEARKDKK